MIRRRFLIPLPLLLLGCETLQPIPHTREPSECQMFGPASMRIHPIFTQVKDWTGDGKPDGIEALVEFQDQFQDPTKAAGKVIFELFTYRKGHADPRGPRLVNPWIGSLTTVEDQRERWNRTSRTYTFQLAWPNVRTDRTYVLTAVFDLASGGRFFDRKIIEAQGREEPAEPIRLTPPATQPAATQPAPDRGPVPET